MTLFIPITKVDEAKRLVYGTLTQEVADKSGEIYDYDSGKAAFQKWSDEALAASGGKSRGNLRAMHGSVAAGKFTDIRFDDAGRRVEGCAKVVDDDEWRKVLEGVYTGFSIGGGYARRWPDRDNPALMRFTPTLAEVSLVDNPCVPTAHFQVIKQDGSTELRKFNAHTLNHHSKEEPMTAPGTPGGEAAAENDLQKQVEEKELALKEAAKQGEQVWKSSITGETFATKAEMTRHNVEQQALAKASGAFDALKSLDAALTKAEAKDGGEEGQDGGEEGREEGGEKAEKGKHKNKAEKDGAEMDAKADGEEAHEEGGEKAGKAASGDLEKAGARHSKADLERVQALHDHADEMHKCFGEMAEKCAGLHKAAARMKNTALELGAEGERADESEGDDSNTKMFKTLLAAEQQTTAALEKVIGTLTSRIGECVERIVHLESQPVPGKGVVKAVAKTQDAGGTGDGKPSAEAVGADLAKLSPNERVKVLMKDALANPVAVTR